MQGMAAQVLDISAAQMSDGAHVEYDLEGDSLLSFSFLTKVEEHYGILIGEADDGACLMVQDRVVLSKEKCRKSRMKGRRMPLCGRMMGRFLLPKRKG
ncbi:MAG: acyl carrier protein [Christensenellales bacterium]|jgi:acyl carrier protein